MKVIDTLILHALVVTVDDDMSIVDDGGIAIEGSTIVAVADSTTLLAQYDATRVIDARGKLLMPGLINTHAHLATVLLRGLAEDLALEPWLNKVWAAENEILNPTNVEIGARLAMTELLLGGTTCAVDMYWFPESTAAAARTTGFRLVNGPVFLEMPSVPDGLSMDDRFVFGREYLQQYQDDPQIHPMLMPHGTYTDSPASLRKVHNLAQEFGARIHIHAAETKAEVDDVVRRYGFTPIELLHDLGMLDERILLAHCVHIRPDEIDLLAKKGAVVAHNPVSNLKLGSGIAPIPAFLRAGVTVALGTDGAQSGNDLNMWLAVRIAALLQKGAHEDATLMRADQMVRMLTRDAAAGIGLGKQIGSLAVGKRADVIMLDLEAAHLIPLHDVYAQLVYAIGREDIHSVWINGREVIRDRQLLTADEDAIKADVQAVAAAMTTAG